MHTDPVRYAIQTFRIKGRFKLALPCVLGRISLRYSHLVSQPCATFVHPKIEFYGLDDPSFDSKGFFGGKWIWCVLDFSTWIHLTCVESSRLRKHFENYCWVLWLVTFRFPWSSPSGIPVIRFIFPDSKFHNLFRSSSSGPLKHSRLLLHRQPPNYRLHDVGLPATLWLVSYRVKLGSLMGISRWQPCVISKKVKSCFYCTTWTATTRTRMTTRTKISELLQLNLRLESYVLLKY